MSFDFRARLDHYLTSEPSHFQRDYYLENVTEELSEEFYNVHGETFQETTLYTEWCDWCFDRDYNVQQAAALIERAHKIYKQ